jgi:hypothetical protein
MGKRLRTYKSKALASVHEIASSLYELELLDKKTMLKLEAACLIREGFWSEPPRNAAERPARSR